MNPILNRLTTPRALRAGALSATCAVSVVASADEVVRITSTAPDGLSFRVQAGAEEGAIIAFDLESWRAIEPDAGEIVIDGFPLTADATVELRLERFEVADERTRFVVGSRNEPLEFDPSRIALFRGSAAGHPGSRVFLALSEHQSAGSIDLGVEGGFYAISSRAGDGTDSSAGQVRIFRAAPVGGGALPVPMCGVDTSGARPHAGGPWPSVADGLPPIRKLQQIELAVETDYEYFSLFGDLDAAGAYIVMLYGAVSDIYVRDVNTRVDLSFVRLWDDPNDLFNGPSPLGEFQDYWEMNMGDVQRDVAQFFSGRRDVPWGGIAYLNGLCNGNAYSVTGYALGFFTDPGRPDVFNRDITVTAHELGHNCATPHTHDLGLDTCHIAESEPRRGSIMSYCGQTFTGGAANMDLRFHTVVQSIMEDYIKSRDCVADDCNQNGIDDLIDIQQGTSPDVNLNFVPDECEDCNNNGTLDPEDIAGGTSFDLNGNGMPDECEPDCNQNGVPDDWDIATGFSVDLYGNGVPDECETDCDGSESSDYKQIQADMSLDLNRNALLDECEDCDGDGTPDLVALDHANNVWLASLDHTTARQYLGRTGTLSAISDNAGISEGNDLLITPDRRMFVASALDHRVIEFDVSGALVGDFVASGVGGLATPAAMTLTPGGNLLVASRGTDEVLEYDGANGAFIGPLVTAGNGGLTEPFGLAYGPNGNLFVTSNDGRVLEYDGGDGSFLAEFVSIAGNGGLEDPHGVLFLPTTGNLLVASYGSDQVLEYDGTTGAFVRQFNQGGTSDRLTLDQPWGIRLGPDGDVYVSRAHLHDPESPAGSGDGSEPLHLTNARIYHFDIDSGFFVRAYVLGLNSGVEHPTGFDFVPDDGMDCNLNLLPDSCDIASSFSADENSNGVPDECECLGDVDGDGAVDVVDLLAILAAWSQLGGPADVNNDGIVDVLDLLAVLSAWGPC